MNTKVALLFIFIGLSIFSCSMVYMDITFQMPELTQVSDGVYRGNNDIKGTPKVSLDVLVQSNKISKIEMIEHGCSPIGKRAERIIEQIIKRQSLNVDVVTGATLSSKAILRAVENALQ